MSSKNQKEFSFNISLPAISVISPQALPISDSPFQGLHIGIAGWSYPDWDGYVYASRTKEKLRFIANYVDMIEINNTFYHPPVARTVQSWIDQTAHLPDFFFTAKLHRDITHGGLIDAKIVSDFHSGFKPMISVGKLRHLLAQFKHDFDDTPSHREHLSKIAGSFSDITNLTLELRHISWQSLECLDYLSTLDVSIAGIDYPQSKDSFNLEAPPIGEYAYLRLHGRNNKAWFDKTAGRDETYNYCYSEKELSEIKVRTDKMKSKAKALTVVANNHYQGKEVVNALQLKALISGKKVSTPPRLLEKYPQLRAINSSTAEP